MPALDVLPELLVADIVEPELLSAWAAEPREHLGEDHGSEAAILLGCELAQSIEPEARLELLQVDEVASLGTSEESEQLVDGELFSGQHRSRAAWLGREEPGVRGQVELGPIVGALDDQSRKAGVHLDVVDGEPGVAECSIDNRDEPIDGFGSQPKKSRSRVSRWTSPRAISAAPPASANSLASSRPAMI